MPQKRHRLRQVRRSAGLTQEELAYRLQIARTTVARWESGATEPLAWMLPKLARLLGVSRAELVSLFEPQPAVPQPAEPDALNDDEHQHMAAALEDARRFLDHRVVSYFRRELDACAQADGQLGAAPTLPRVLGILSALETCAGEVKLSVLSELLSVAARGAEFAGWLYRDAQDATQAKTWYSRATEWAQEANDTAMQGYVLLKKSQMAYDNRDARRVLTLAQAAQYGPWPLSNYIRAEVTQQEARGLAMVGESLTVVEQKLGHARALFGSATDIDAHTQLGSTYSADTLTLRDASCYIEAGKPHQAAVLYQQVLTADVLSRRDRGYFMARLTSSLALSGEPDEAAGAGLTAAQLASSTGSQRTRRELMRSLVTLKPWENRPGPRALREAVRAQAS